MGTSFGSTWTPYVVGEAAPPFPGHSRQPARETDLRHLVELLRRHARLLILTTAFFIAAAAVIVLLLPAVYTSTTLVLFDPSRKNLLDTAGPASSGSADSARIDSEVEIIRSDEILLAVSASENLAADPEYGAAPSLSDTISRILPLPFLQPPGAEEAGMKALERLRKNISVQRRGSTHVIAISARSSDPARAAELANVVAETYIARQLERKVEATLAGRDKIESQLTDARAAVVAAETAFRNYLVDNIDEVITATGNSDVEQLHAELDTLLGQSNTTRLRMDRLQAQLARSDWTGLARTLQAPEAMELEKQRIELMLRLGRTDLGMPADAATHESLSAVESALTSVAHEEFSRLRSTLARTNSLIAERRQQLSIKVLEGHLPPEILAPFYGLQQSAQVAASSYEALLSRLRALETEASIQMSDSRVVSTAFPAARPVFPNKPLILSLAGIGGLGLGIALAFLFENYFGGFTDARQVEAVLRRRVATVLPRALRGSGSVADAVVEAPLSTYSEAVRKMRAILDASLQRVLSKAGAERGQVIVVSSALPGEGKTTLALSLARTYALSGRNVLIIDCDMRKPRLHHHLAVDASTGLIDILIRNAPNRDLSGILVRDPISPAMTIVGARRADLPTDQLVASEAFRQIIASARRNFDYVILDTPPLEPLVDGLYLCQHADAVVFVIRWARTPQQVAASALERIAELVPPGAATLLALTQKDGATSPSSRKARRALAAYEA